MAGHGAAEGSWREKRAGPLRFDGNCWVRTLDPLIKSNHRGISTEIHDDLKLEDLYTWN